jgi:hypothetical protein
MRSRTRKAVLGIAIFLALPAADARAHWCDDMWSSAYNLVVRPDSDTSPKEIYVQNNMGYQLPNFKLTATSSSGGAITLTPPTTLKVANTLLPGEKGVWKITGGSPAKIEDLTFSVAFGLDFAGWTTQDACYPLAGTKPVMVVKNDGTLYPPNPTGLADSKAPPSPCVGIVALGRSLQYKAAADFEDVNAGLDKLLQYYCAGRASWGIDDAVTKTYCKDTSSTTCPASKPTGVGRVSDYVHLYAASDLAIRKEALGARLPVLRERLKCGANDGDLGFAGLAIFVLGYLGEDAATKSFLQTQASASGDLGTIAKAALYLMGDTTRKADVQAGVKSSSVFVKVACAGALGIVDKDDASVNSALIPSLTWLDPSTTAEDGKGMYAAHILDIVAFDRRGWVAKGGGDGVVTFYGETGGGTGGVSGTGGSSGTAGTSGTGGAVGSGGTAGGGGATGNRDGGTDAPSGTGGLLGNGGRSGSGGAAVGGSSGPGGSPGGGGMVGSGGQVAGGAGPQGSGGAAGAAGGAISGSGGETTAGGSSGVGGSPLSSGGNPGGTNVESEKGQSSGCGCDLGGRPDAAALSFLALAGLALLRLRRRTR